jgi:neutral ceramidase
VKRLLGLLLLLAGCANPGDRRPGSLEVGASEIDITPPLGYRMAGYFYERLNTGTKDPLKAKAIVLAHGDLRAALVFCDLASVPASVTSRSRQEAERRTGIPAAHIAVAATHSHTGPLYTGGMAKILHERAVAAEGRDAQDFDYASQLSERIVQAVQRAASALRPATLSAGLTEELTLSFNRRFRMKDGTVRTNPGALNPEILSAAGPIDPELSLIVARDGERAFAALSVFALHCDTTGGTEYSADYPYYLERDLRASLGESFISLFGAGTCGDINHIDVSRKKQRSAKEIGVALGQDALAEFPKLKPVAPALAMRSSRVDVPLQKRTAQDLAAARADVAKVGAKETPFLEQVRIVTTLHLGDLPPVLPLEVQVLRLSADVAIVTLPGEIFVEHGLAIKRQSPFAHTIVIELANDNCAYVPTKAAFAQGAYEVENSRVTPGGGERIVAEAVRLLKDLWDAKS